MRVLVIAADSELRTRVRAELASHPGVTIVGEPETLAAARARLGQADHDLVFLATQVTDRRSLDLLPLAQRRARLVLMAGSQDPLAETVADAGAERLLTPLRTEQVAALIARLRAAPTRPPFLVPVKVGTMMRVVRAEQIRLVASRENYTVMVNEHGERTFVRRTMRQWQEYLPAGQFARAHRTLWVNLEHLVRIERVPNEMIRLHFTDEQPAPRKLARRYGAALHRHLEAWCATHRSTPPRAEPVRAVAVLPLDNPHQDLAVDLLGDRIAETLIEHFEQLQQFHVTARTPAFAFRGQTKPLPEIARALGVDRLVRGSIRRREGCVLVSVEVLRGADGVKVGEANAESRQPTARALRAELSLQLAQALTRLLAPGV